MPRRTTRPTPARAFGVPAALLGAVGLGAMGTAALVGAGTAQAARPDPGTLSAELAEAQFRAYLLANTTLHPTDVSCAQPPTQDPDGEMLCFALLDDRETVAALATLVSPGVYEFTAVTKSASPVPGSATPATPAAPDTAVTPDAPAASPDDVVLDAIASVTGPDVGDLTQTLLDFNVELTSIDSITFDEPTGTLQVRATSSATTTAEHDWLGWRITDTMAFLWESSGPLRAEGVTLQPRLEVIVDDALYGTPFPVMIDVADYQIDFEGWLAITTGADTGGGEAGGLGRGLHLDRAPAHPAPAVRRLAL